MSAQANDNQPPNILLITTDQQRWDFYDNRTADQLRTPALSRLMREGTAMIGATSNCPVCIPTRFSWCHGLYASQVANSLGANCHDWPSDLPSMPKALQSAGYYTALIGKLHSHEGLYHRDLCHPDYIADTHARGFNHVSEVCGKGLAFWFDCRWTRHLRRRGLLDKYRGDIAFRNGIVKDGKNSLRPGFLSPDDSIDGFIGREANKWLETYAQEDPFFLHVSFCGPHPPFDPPVEYARRYKAEDMPPPEGVDDPEKIKKSQRMRALYCAMIEHIDDRMGDLFNCLEERGLMQNTAVFFATDHGEMLGHLDMQSKAKPWDTSVRTPYVIRWPGRVQEGVELDGPVEAVDLPCTIMDVAGLGGDAGRYLPGSPGRSFLPYAADGKSQPRSWSYSEFTHGKRAWRMCREPDWKYVWRPNGDMLFNLREDPWEFNNLIDNPDCGDHVSRLRRQLIESMSETTPPDSIEVDQRNDWWLEDHDAKRCQPK
ncbi:MAG: sulfatase [Candidatus Brocadiia bacterium]